MKDKKDPFKTDKSLYDYTTQYDITHLPKPLQDIIADLEKFDKNEGNWGLVIDKETKELRIAPVFDNGAAFYNKSSNEKLNSIYDDPFKFKQSVYDSAISIYKEGGKQINPLKFIETMNNEECNKAILRIIPKINMDKILNIFDEIPEEYNGLPVYNKLISLENSTDTDFDI